MSQPYQRRLLYRVLSRIGVDIGDALEVSPADALHALSLAAFRLGIALAALIFAARV